MKAAYHKLTVLQVLPALVAGGVERGTLEIAAALIKAGHTSLVASRGGPLVEALEQAGSIHLAGSFHSKNPFKIIYNSLKLLQILRRYKVDILHVRSRAPAWSAWLATRLWRSTVLVTTFHGYYRHHSWFKRWYNSGMVRGAHVICGSRFIYEHVRHVYGTDPDHMSLIHRGVDIDYFAPQAVLQEQIDACRQWSPKLAEGRQIILLPGRVTSWKGHHIALQSLATLLPTQPNLILLFVGHFEPESAYVKQLTDLIVKNNLSEQVAWVPQQNDLRPWYMLAAVVLSTSTAPETFGRTIVEAAAMQRLVIATDLGGAKETVLDKETGWLIPPADPSALARAIQQALALDAATLQAMQSKAREHVRQHFRLQKMCDETLAIYNKYAMLRL